MSLYTIKTAVSVEWWRQYADCLAGSRQFSSQWLTKCTATAHSTSFDTNDSWDIGRMLDPLGRVLASLGEQWPRHVSLTLGVSHFRKMRCTRRQESVQTAWRIAWRAKLESDRVDNVSLAPWTSPYYLVGDHRLEHVEIQNWRWVIDDWSLCRSSFVEIIP